jgi:hypothetical protein
VFGTAPGREHLAVSACQLPLDARPRNVRRDHRRSLRCLEQAHRKARRHHINWNAPVGAYRSVVRAVDKSRPLAGLFFSFVREGRSGDVWRGDIRDRSAACAAALQGKSRRKVARQLGISRDSFSKMCRYAAPPGYVRTKPVDRLRSFLIVTSLFSNALINSYRNSEISKVFCARSDTASLISTALICSSVYLLHFQEIDISIHYMTQ